MVLYLMYESSITLSVARIYYLYKSLVYVQFMGHNLRVFCSYQVCDCWIVNILLIYMIQK